MNQLSIFFNKQECPHSHYLVYVQSRLRCSKIPRTSSCLLTQKRSISPTARTSTKLLQRHQPLQGLSLLASIKCSYHTASASVPTHGLKLVISELCITDFYISWCFFLLLQQEHEVQGHIQPPPSSTPASLQKTARAQEGCGAQDVIELLGE